MFFKEIRALIFPGVFYVACMCIFPLFGSNNSNDCLEIIKSLIPDTEAPHSLQGLDLLDKDRLPKHIAIIMDGNRRWAKENNLSIIEGHARGADAVVRLLNFISTTDLGIEALTLYTFSTENWSRPQNEVKELMELIARCIDSLLPKCISHSIRFETIGDLTLLPEILQKKIEYVKSVTKTSSNFTLILALNYGGRNEITRAFNRLLVDIEKGLHTKEDVSEELIQSYLDTSFVRNPDFLIRTSKEQRLSNFLLWQAAYSEFYFPSIYWPDFFEQEFVNALLEFQSRNRRFGGSVNVFL